MLHCSVAVQCSFFDYNESNIVFFYTAHKQCAYKKTRFLPLKLIKLLAGDKMRRDVVLSHCIARQWWTVLALIIMRDLNLFTLQRAKQHKTTLLLCIHCKQHNAMWQSLTLCACSVDSIVDYNESEYFVSTLQGMQLDHSCYIQWNCLLGNFTMRRKKCNMHEFAI